MTSQQLADSIKGMLSDLSSADSVAQFTAACVQVGSDMQIDWLIDGGCTAAQAAMIMSSNISDRLQKIGIMCRQAATNGYLLPADPSIQLASLNFQRQLFAPLAISPTGDVALVTTAVELSKIWLDVDSGTISFARSSAAGMQLAHFEVSVDGIAAQSGDPLVDILGYQPDADFVKRKRALDALAKLDFSKRKPYLLFTADVIQDGKRTPQTIVCWQRMRDASGYVLARRDVFGQVDLTPMSLSSADIETSTAALLQQPTFQQVLSFYDWLDGTDVLAWTDDQTQSDTLYSYTVSGVQKKAPASPFIFDVPMTSLYLSPAQAAAIVSAISTDLSTFADGTDTDAVSPYPEIAQVLYGDPAIGWILAGCNVLASQRRGDSTDVTRQLSYIGSKASQVLAASTAGKLSVPADVSAVQALVASAISSYGVSQTILSILDGVGLTMFTAGKDDPLGFQPTDASLQEATGGLAKILSAIDPESATVDPHVLASALATSSAPATKGSRYAATNYSFASGAAVTKADPPDIDTILGTAAIDLTTYQGIARLMQLIRTLYDFYPGTLT